MSQLENSLCATCEHLIYCSLTNDKQFIWSCSEYEVSEYQEPAFYEKIIKKATDFTNSDGKMMVV